MTSLCGGGTSSLKPGVGGEVVFDAALITAGLGLISPFLLPFAGLVDSFTYEALTQCSSDPPAMPSSDDLSPVNAIGGVLNPNFGNWLNSVHSLILNYAWQQYCQCDSASPPSFNYPGAPSGVTVGNQPTANACFNGSFSGTCPSNTGDSVQLTCISACPPGAISTILPITGGTAQGVNVPVGQYSSITTTMTQTFPSSPNDNSHARWGFWTSSLTFISFSPVITFIQGPSATVTQTFTAAVPATAAWVALFAGNDIVGGTLAHVDSCLTQFFCGGQTDASPCVACPPDPTIGLVLNTILQIVNNNYAQINLIQRQAVPFAYVPGASHSGLSGSGEIAFSDLLGVKITPSSIPPSAGVDVGDPDSLWLDSWIRWGNADGWTQREFLTSAPFVSFPTVAGQYTRIGYTLRPGLSVDILELVREP